MAVPHPIPAAPHGRIITFLKAPHPGAVKSRLAASLDAPAAAAIYRTLITRTLTALRTFTSVELRHTPDDAAVELQPLLRTGWRLRPQGPGDLGERLERAFSDAFREGARAAVVLGTDAPEIEARDLADAFRALEAADVVLGPALDGGYWLVGLRRSAPFLFHDMPWSTAEVARLTRERAQANHLAIRELRTLSDIDTLEDWRRWLREGPL